MFQKKMQIQKCKNFVWKIEILKYFQSSFDSVKENQSFLRKMMWRWREECSSTFSWYNEVNFETDKNKGIETIRKLTSGAEQKLATF